MRTKLAIFGTLGLAAALPTAAFADHDHDRDGRRGGASIRFGDFSLDLGYGSWTDGHYETREVRRTIPAVVRQEWTPDRVEEVCVPAVTERVCVPAVTERVYVPAVVERREVPARVERRFVPGRYESVVDVRGCAYRVWVEAHDETRVVREARCEQIVVCAAHYEERVVRPAHEEIRIVVPERRETRVVERGRLCTVVVSPARTEVCRERVWVPGHWETRPARERC